MTLHSVLRGHQEVLLAVMQKHSFSCEIRITEARKNLSCLRRITEHLLFTDLQLHHNLPDPDIFAVDIKHSHINDPAKIFIYLRAV